MHCVLLADLAALVSQHAAAVLYRRAPVPPEAVTDYWVASRSRLDLWHQVISRNRVAHHNGDWLELQRWWNDHLAVLEEILVSEILTRIVAALATSLDHESQTGARSISELDGDETGEDTEVSPVMHAIHLSHLEIRNRVQFLMLNNRGCRVADAVRLNRLRQATERWTDTLLGRMSLRHREPTKYAFDRTLADRYAEEARDGYGDPGISAATGLMNAAIHDALYRRMDPAPALPQANLQVSQSVLKMFGQHLFDSYGTLKSLGLHRIEMDSLRAAKSPERPPECENEGEGEWETGIAFQTDKVFQRWYLA